MVRSALPTEERAGAMGHKNALLLDYLERVT
ncbi:hypothetical protein BV95_04044 [Sphingobium chlorophenolicum]|uniref:Uncharacterized protein n=1 Tax=Sphingobium chlorophenolicum TaxID=46429 RepID=A0A081R937_SPHCR|nr:hypothetical protein BV95_04044 [Sphingobium chlorophenolicum]